MSQPSSLKLLGDYFDAHRKQIIEDYFAFLRFPSISSEPQYKQELLSCAQWLVHYLQAMGLAVELWETKGHPVIYASHLKAGKQQPTLLLYGHYDVQPVDPLEAWDSPPFVPTLKGMEVYARGAQDNKGQCFYFIQALKALLERNGTLPINVKLCIEGEEEMGSRGLASLLTFKKKELQADYLAIVDMGLSRPSEPAVTLGVRGIATLEVEIEESNIDLHSGSHGGIVYNPIRALAELLAKLHDSTGKVAIPGFYSSVEELPARDKELISFDFDAAEYEKIFGIQPLGGEKGLSPFERAWIRPTVEINGISGGYTGVGFKTVIPSKAMAKLSARLVPHQDPHEITTLIIDFLKRELPVGLKISTRLFEGGGPAVRAAVASPVVKAFAEAYGEVFQKPCRYIFSGGSIPIAAELAKASNSDILLLGLGLATDQIHAPNEHFGLDRLEKGFLIIARALEILAR